MRVPSDPEKIQKTVPGIPFFVFCPASFTSFERPTEKIIIRILLALQGNEHQDIEANEIQNKTHVKKRTRRNNNHDSWNRDRRASHVMRSHQDRALITTHLNFVDSIPARIDRCPLQVREDLAG